MARKEGTVYKRGTRWWMGFKDHTGKMVYRKCGPATKTEAQAEKVLAIAIAKVRAGIEYGASDGGPVTVARYFERWVERRKALVQDTKSESGRMKKHVLPRLGQMPIDEVRPRHLVDLFTALRVSGKLAPKSIHNIYGLVRRMFSDAMIDEVVTQSPCVLTKVQLGGKEDRDPEWRATAVYAREEVVNLIAAPDIPVDRQVLYALQGLGGLRHGEAAGLRWRDYHPSFKPLGKLLVARTYDDKRTKTKTTRQVPVHPTLAAMLDEWKREGWKEMIGREPEPDDLLIPSREGVVRSRHHSLHKLHEDLDRLGYRKRRGHDLRRTFISLARSDGARPDILRRVTHNPGTDIMDVYTSLDWPVLCAEVEKLRLTRPEGVKGSLETRWRTEPKVGLPPPAAAEGSDLLQFTTSSTKAAERASSGSLLVEAPGIEPGSEKAPILADPCSVDVYFRSFRTPTDRRTEDRVRLNRARRRRTDRHAPPAEWRPGPAPQAESRLDVLCYGFLGRESKLNVVVGFCVFSQVLTRSTKPPACNSEFTLFVETTSPPCHRTAGRVTNNLRPHRYNRRGR